MEATIISAPRLVRPATPTLHAELVPQDITKIQELLPMITAILALVRDIIYPLPNGIPVIRPVTLVMEDQRLIA